MAINRMNKIDEELKKEISNIITTELKNPHLTGLISVTKVKTTPSLIPLFSAYFLATLIAHSFASAPEFEKNTFLAPVFSQSILARFTHGFE